METNMNPWRTRFLVFSYGNHDRFGASTLQVFHRDFMDTIFFKIFLCSLELGPVPRWFVTSGTLSQHLKSTKRTLRHGIMENFQSGGLFFPWICRRSKKTTWTFGVSDIPFHRCLCWFVRFFADFKVMWKIVPQPSAWCWKKNLQATYLRQLRKTWEQKEDPKQSCHHKSHSGNEILKIICSQNQKKTTGTCGIIPLKLGETSARSLFRNGRNAVTTVGWNVLMGTNLMQEKDKGIKFPVQGALNKNTWRLNWRPVFLLMLKKTWSW